MLLSISLKQQQQICWNASDRKFSKELHTKRILKVLTLFTLETIKAKSYLQKIS